MNKFLSLVMVVVFAMSVSGYGQGYPTFSQEGKVVTASVTNGQTIVLSAPEMRLTPYGETDGSTCTLTVSPNYHVDGLILITVDHAATNSITLTDATTTLNLGGANRVIKPGQSILLKPVATNKCNMVAGSFFSTAGTVTVTKQTTKIYDSHGLMCSNATATAAIDVVTNATATVTFTVP